MDGGNIYGRLELQNVERTDLDSVIENKIDDKCYESLGKRVVNVLYKPLSLFFLLLQTNYGPYWIPEFTKWDSRKESLGHYCGTYLSMTWRLDPSDPPKRFVPTKDMVIMAVRMSGKREYGEFLTQSDWRQIPDLVNKDYKPTIAAVLLARTHEYIQNGDLKHALIEGVTALELAIAELMRARIHTSGLTEPSINSFLDSGIKTQLVSMATTMTIVEKNLDQAIKAIDMRHKVVHEGWSPDDTALVELRGLLKTVAALQSGPNFKFPPRQTGNTIMDSRNGTNLNRNYTRTHDKLRCPMNKHEVTM